MRLRIGFGGPIGVFSRVGDDIGSGPIDHGIVSRTSVDMALVVTRQSEQKKLSGCILIELSGHHEDPSERYLQRGDWL